MASMAIYTQGPVISANDVRLCCADMHQPVQHIYHSRILGQRCRNKLSVTKMINNPQAAINPSCQDTPMFQGCGLVCTAFEEYCSMKYDYANSNPDILHYNNHWFSSRLLPYRPYFLFDHNAAMMIANPCCFLLSFSECNIYIYMHINDVIITSDQAHIR